MNTFFYNRIYYPTLQKLLFPTIHKSFLCRETILVKELAASIEYAANTARQNVIGSRG